MKSRGIIFSAPMIRALLDGGKTQTRRLAKLPPQPDHRGGWEATTVGGDGSKYGDGSPAPEHAAIWNKTTGMVIACPYGVVGDRFWVRETHAQFAVGNRAGTAPQCVAYRATCDEDGGFDYVNNGDEILRLKVTKWTPAIFMPRWASRITLEITDIRAQRLHDITEADAKAEGVEPFFTRFTEIGREQRITSGEFARDAEHRASFACLWDEINGDRTLWTSNPWVWALTFRVVTEPSR